MTEDRSLFDLITATLWPLLALIGVILRTRRAIRLRHIVLVDPVEQKDIAYLASVKRSTYLRLSVKIVFLIGGLIALFGLPWLWPVWRVGIVVVLMCMLAETVSVDMIRDRMGRTAPESG